MKKPESPKRILILTYNDYPVYEGLGVRISNLSRVLIEKGHRVTIFAPNIDNQQPETEDFPGGRIIRTNIYVPTFLKKNRVIARACSMLLQTLRSPFVYRTHLKKEQPDLILAEHIYAIPPAIVIKTFTGAKIFVDDIITVSDALKDAGYPRLVKAFTWFEKALFKRCHDFIYTSPTSERYYRDRGAKPTLYVPNGVNCDVFKPLEAPQHPVTVFFNGSTYSTQNTAAAANFIQIGQKLMEMAVPNLQFRLVCWPAYNLPEPVRQVIQQDLPWLSYAEGVAHIEAEIGKASITLLPYSRGHHLTGGVRLKALEYMACGKVVVSTPEGVEGITGLVPGEHYLLAETIEEFPNIIAAITNDPEKASQIARNARNFVLDHYDWRKTMQDLTDRLEHG